jgi:UDP:flavonoid glycosyltransferase YjiC (YdhE family)
VRIEPWVDQRRVLGQAELVVSHGGSGTTFGALAAGIPVLAIPLFADQPANARRLAESGAGMMLELGSAPDGRRRLPGPGDGALIAAAVRELRSQSSYRARAAAIAAEMAGAPAAGARVGELLGGVEPTPQTI